MTEIPTRAYEYVGIGRLWYCDIAQPSLFCNAVEPDPFFFPSSGFSILPNVCVGGGLITEGRYAHLQRTHVCHLLGRAKGCDWLLKVYSRSAHPKDSVLCS